jgi:hypothetical protein
MSQELSSYRPRPRKAPADLPEARPRGRARSRTCVARRARPGTGRRWRCRSCTTGGPRLPESAPHCGRASRTSKRRRRTRLPRRRQAVDRPRGHLGPAHHAPALGQADQGSHRALLGELRLAVWPRSDRRHGVPAPWLEEITSALAALAAPAAEDTRPLAA